MNASLRSMSPKAQFAWNDPLLLKQQLSEQERMVQDATQTRTSSHRASWKPSQEKPDPAIFREMSELGLLGATLPPDYARSAKVVLASAMH